MRVYFITIMLLIYVPMQAQNAFDSLITEIQNQKKPLTNFPTEIVLKQEKMMARITTQQNAMLNKLFKLEKRILKAIRKEDHLINDELLKTCEAKYNNIINLCKQAGVKNTLTDYVGRVDSIETVLNFLKEKQPGNETISKALESIDILKGKINHSEMITRFISERKMMLQSLVSKYKKLPYGMIRSVEKYNIQFDNYKKQAIVWKDNLSDPVKMEETVLAGLNKIPAFKTFWQESSQVAKLFRGSSITIPSSAGFQYRGSVVQELRQRFGSEIVDPKDILQQNLRLANKELNEFKTRIDQLNNVSIDTKTKRPSNNEQSNQLSKILATKLGFGFNLQTGKKAAYNFPVSNDLGLWVGYKFKDKVEMGIGMSYKFGLGASWKKIKLTHDGIGLRSYIDVEISSTHNGLPVLFSNLWLSGGYEQNYWRTFRNFPDLKQVAWQASGLVGVSKKIQVDSKFFKYAKMQVLWDFLNYKQITVSQPIVFRVGYSIK